MVETQTFIALCTSHLDKESRDFLDRSSERGNVDGTLCGEHQYGWFAWVGQERPQDDLPAALAHIAKWAQGQDITYVNFDRDVAEIDDLPVLWDGN